MLKLINDRIKDADILGHKHIFKYEKRDIYSTTIGGLISIVVIVAAWLVIGNYAYELFDFKHPIVVESVTKSTQYPIIDLYKYNFVP